jgi:hypothetical protein
MERLLMVWTNRHVPLNQTIIQNKVQNLFNDMKAKKFEAAKDAEFVVSRGWFDRFNKGSDLHDVEVQGEAAAADTVDADILPRDLTKIIDDGGCMKDDIFNVDETGPFWKKMPSRTFIAKAK